MSLASGITPTSNIGSAFGSGLRAFLSPASTEVSNPAVSNAASGCSVGRAVRHFVSVARGAVPAVVLAKVHQLAGRPQ